VPGSQRTSPDVAYNADPYTGVWVYDSYYGGGWGEYGGTSAGAPQWAGLIAIVNQGRTTGALSSSGTLGGLYSLLSNTDTINATYLHDVTSGSSGTYSAAPGYDAVTGLGSPKANTLIPYLRGVSANAVVNPASSPATPSGGSSPSKTVGAHALVLPGGSATGTDSASLAAAALAGVATFQGTVAGFPGNGAVPPVVAVSPPARAATLPPAFLSPSKPVFAPIPLTTAGGQQDQDEQLAAQDEDQADDGALMDDEIETSGSAVTPAAVSARLSTQPGAPNPQAVTVLFARESLPAPATLEPETSIAEAAPVAVFEQAGVSLEQVVALAGLVLFLGGARELPTTPAERAVNEKPYRDRAFGPLLG
jgi:hypothetical protein